MSDCLVHRGCDCDYEPDDWYDRLYVLDGPSDDDIVEAAEMGG